MSAAAKAGTVRIGMAGYVAFLAALRDTPCTLSEAPAVAGVGHTCAWHFISGMYALRLIRISGYRMSPGKCTAPVFSPGSDPDAPPPAFRPSGRPIDGIRMPKKVQPRPELLAFKSLLSALELPSSRTELAASTGLHWVTIKSAVNALVEHGFAHIAMWHWRDHGGPPLEQFQIGRGVNARRPDRMKRREIRRRYDSRKREAAPFAGLAAAFSNGV